MKIRTIIGVLLVIALVLGSTGVAFAANDANGDGPIRDRLCDGSCNQDRNRNCNCDEDCDQIGDGPHNGPNYTD